MEESGGHGCPTQRRVQVLLNHVIPGAFSTVDLRRLVDRSQGAALVQTLGGGDLLITTGPRRNGRRIVQIQSRGLDAPGAVIETAQGTNRVCSGFAHVINRVLAATLANGTETRFRTDPEVRLTWL